MNADRTTNRHKTVREGLRIKGQFWTPQWIARPMVRYSMPESGELLDPAFGMGAFLEAFTGLGGTGKGMRFVGREVDAEILREFSQRNTSTDYKVDLRDFILDPPSEQYTGIIANPPYVRHHRLTPEVKAKGRLLSIEAMGRPLDARAGLHIYFLIQSLMLLEPGGKLAFIMPADVCEGIFANRLWNWIASTYRIDCVITFAPAATPFPGIDTNPIILFLRNNPPAGSFSWAKVMAPGGLALDSFVADGFGEKDDQALKAVTRPLAEGLATGLSREPACGYKSRHVLGEFAFVRRGIVSGANGFFLMTRTEVRQRGIANEFLLPAVARTRDVAGDLLAMADLDRLDAKGRPTMLLSPDGRSLNDFPSPVLNYLRDGERTGIPKGAVCSARRPWYRMETRLIPPILFAYLGRRNARFIQNLAGAVPLNGFLCLYPRSNDQGFAESLWAVLSDARTAGNLRLVGKSYGCGAIKVEPRALERLPIPDAVLKESGLERYLNLAGETTGRMEKRPSVTMHGNVCPFRR